ncbi:choice-of-anchor R domain-containing protein [Candidatus Poriferisodalis sp.]|uniref:choice-of-anchor R domain-containing protein n=1 Tax=Candidatus Poriferisodalis sp. TaxID=3101277 RepID=UPI003B01A1F4
MAVLAALLVAVPAGAQSPTSLVSNLGLTASAFGGPGARDYAQAFTTGGNSAGYSLSSVDVHFENLTDAAWASKLAVTVNAAVSGNPGAVLGTLTPSSTGTFSTAQNLRFAAPGSGISLAADTTYFVVLDSIAGWIGSNNLRTSIGDGEDAGGAPGWSIADTSLNRFRQTSVGWAFTGDVSLRIAVNGTANAASDLLVSAPSVVNVREGQTVSVRLDLAKEVTGRVPVTVVSSDPSRVRVNHPDQLFMGRKYANGHNGSNGVVGVQVQTSLIPGSGRLVGNRGTHFDPSYGWSDQDRYEPSGSIGFDFDAADWAGYTSIEEPVLHKGFRVVEVTGVASGADGLPANGPDAKFQLLLSSSHSSVAFAPITVVVKRSRGLDPVFDPDPKSGFGCRERECLRVDEGGSVSYTVRNSNVPAPGSPLTITPTGEGLSFDPAVVSWTHRDHDEPRTVTVTAAHDSDVRSDTRIIRHAFSENWDTSGSLSRILGQRTESNFNMAVRVVDDDLTAFDAVGADGAVISQVSVLSRAGESRSGAGRFWVRVDGAPDCTTGYGRSAGLCWDTLRIRLRTGRPDGSWDNAPVAATVHRAAQAGASPLSYSKVAGPRHWYAMHIRPEHWDRLLRVDLTLDPALYGTSGSYVISMSLERDNGEPSAHRRVTVSYGPNLETSPSVDDNVPVSDGDPVPDGQQAPPHGQDQADQQQAVPDADSGGADPAPYAADAGVVAAVQYLASQTHHGFAHVNRWQRALAAIGALDPADVTGGAMSLAEARRNASRYSSPVWDQVVAEIEAKQAHDTAQQQQQQQPVGDGQPPPPPVVPEVTVASGSGATEGSAVSFTVAASPAPAGDLAVSVTIAAAGDYGVTAGTRTVTIPAGSSSATLTVDTVGDTTDEPDGTITAAVADGDGYTVGAAAAATVTVSDDDDPPPAYVMDPALIAEVQAHIASFRARSHHAGIRDWTAVLDRLEGRSGAMSDDRIAAWLDRSRRHGWADGIDTLPKVQAALTAQAAAS